MIPTGPSHQLVHRISGKVFLSGRLALAMSQQRILEQLRRAPARSLSAIGDQGLLAYEQTTIIMTNNAQARVICIR